MHNSCKLNVQVSIPRVCTLMLNLRLMFRAYMCFHQSDHREQKPKWRDFITEFKFNLQFQTINNLLKILISSLSFKLHEIKITVDYRELKKDYLYLASIGEQRMHH